MAKWVGWVMGQNGLKHLMGWILLWNVLNIIMEVSQQLYQWVAQSPWIQLSVIFSCLNFFDLCVFTCGQMLTYHSHKAYVLLRTIYSRCTFSVFWVLELSFVLPQNALFENSKFKFNEIIIDLVKVNGPFETHEQKSCQQ